MDDFRGRNPEVAGLRRQEQYSRTTLATGYVGLSIWHCGIIRCRDKIASIMKHQWVIEEDDISRIRQFVMKQSDNPFVRERIRHNLADVKPPVSRAEFWSATVACLLTTQQRSGPTSQVTKFLLLKPAPLQLDICEQHQDLADFVRQTLTDFGGLRRAKTIGKELKENLPSLQGDRWLEVQKHLEAVRLGQSAEAERKAANFIDKQLRGFGPKQSRNLLQTLGLSRYEIPLDSRLTKWFRQFGFPIGLSANLLADVEYYEFVLDAIQELCQRAQVFPCVLDAMIFVSFDADAWTEENVVW